MKSRQSKWEERRTEHRLYVEIVADITTRNQLRQDMQFDKMNNTNFAKTCDKQRTTSNDNAHYA